MRGVPKPKVLKDMKLNIFSTEGGLGYTLTAQFESNLHLLLVSGKLI